MNAGDALPVLERTLTPTDLVAYAGATWDWHPLHHDREWVAAAGLPGTVVDGQMLGALMASAALRAFGPRARLTTLAFRLRSMVLAGETVRCEGEVTVAAEGHVRVAQRVLVGERIAAEGTAEVAL